MILFIILILAFLLLSNFFLPLLSRVVRMYRIKKYCKKEGILILSYDDGPGKILTSKLLNLFNREQIHVSFFFLGLRVERHREIVLKAKQFGHEIGFHGQNHLNYWIVSPFRAIGDINSGLETLSFTKYSDITFRPPYGKLTLIPWLMLCIRKIPILYWTYSINDTMKKLKPVEDVIKEVEKNNGGVILLHDFDRSKEYEKFVLDVSEQLILTAKKNGWKIKKLCELIQVI